MEHLAPYYEMISQAIVHYGLKLLGSAATFILGLWIIRGVSAAMARIMERSAVDPGLRSFLKSLTNIALKTMLVITVLSMLGVQMTSFVAVLGAAGLAVGMAFSGNLQNLAGGVLILIFKPFKVGDFIDAMGYMGTVHQIQIFATILKAVDNKTIVLPNGALSSGSLVNLSTEPTRRAEWTFGIAYGDSTELARTTLQTLLDEDERILKDPASLIAVSALADSSVNLVVRAWVNSSDLWEVFFEMNEKVYNRFGEVGLNIPFPQMDVHLPEKKR